MERVQANHGGSDTQIPVATAVLPAPATAGNLLLLALASDAFATAGAPVGWTESSECRQHTFLGHYFWWKVADGGETSIPKNLAIPGTHAWVVEEWTGNDPAPYVDSQGAFVQSSGSSYTTPDVTPPEGDYLTVASVAGSHGTTAFTDLTSWSNGYAADATHGKSASDITGAHDIVGMAFRSVEADGITAYSTNAAYLPFNAEARTGIMLVFKPGAGDPIDMGMDLGPLVLDAAAALQLAPDAAAAVPTVNATTVMGAAPDVTAQPATIDVVAETRGT